jgi:hypothetical protein
LAEIKLAWHEKSSNQNTELLKWLCNGIMLEDELYVLYNNNLYLLLIVNSDNVKHYVSQKAQNVSQKLGLYERKEELHERIQEFNQGSLHFLKLHADLEASVSSQEDDDKDFEDAEDVFPERTEEEANMQDQVMPLLPSNISGSSEENGSEIEEARVIEMDLRKGRRNYALER